MDGSIITKFVQDVQSGETSHPFPSHDIDPRKKAEDPTWHKEMCAAILAEAGLQDRQRSNYSRRNDWLLNRQYADGNQPNNKYVKQLTSANEDGSREGYYEYDWTIHSIIPRYRDVVLGYLKTLKYDVVCNAIDSYATSDKERVKFKIWVDKMLAERVRKIEEMAKMNLTTKQFDYLPESMEELEIYMEYSGLKLPEEMTFEEGINLCKYINEWVQIMERVDEDLVDCGIACTKTYTDINSRVKIRYCDMANVIFLGKSDRMDVRKLIAIGELRLLSIHELKEVAGDTFTQKEYMEIANEAAGYNGNSNNTFNYNDHPIDSDQMYGYPWDTYKIAVFDAQYDSNDTVTQLKRYYGKGDDDYKYYNKPRDYKMSKSDKKDKRNKVEYTYVNTKYEATWIVGTNYVFNFGKVKDIIDCENDLSQTEYDYTIYKVANKSMTERMIPTADSMQLTRLKLQQLKAKAKPNGVMVNLRNISNIEYGGQKLNSKQVLQIYSDQGDLLYDGGEHYDIDNPYIGTGTPAAPVTELAGGIGQQFNELIESLNWDITEMERITGINEIFAGSTPQRDQLVGTAQIAERQTINSLRSLITGREYIIEKTYQKIGGKLQWIGKYGDIEKYKQALGAATVSNIKANINWSLRHFGIKIEAQVTEEEKQMLYQTAMQAMNQRTQTGKGGLQYHDFLMIVRKIRQGQVRAAEALMQYRIQKQQEEDAKREQMLIQQNNQGQSKATQIAEAEKRKTQQEELMNDLVKKRVESYLKMIEDNNKAHNDRLLEAMKEGHDIKKVQSDSEKHRAELNAKLETEMAKISQQREQAQLQKQQQSKPQPQAA